MNDSRDTRRESGAALLVAVLMLALIGVAGLASMDTVAKDRQIAGFQNRSKPALYAAEAGVAAAIGLIRQDAQDLAGGGEAALLNYNPSGWSPPGFPEPGSPQSLGTVSGIGAPSYSRDPAASDPDNPGDPPRVIRYIGKGLPCPGWIMSGGAGSVEWAEALFDIRVIGRSPGGSTVPIQATGSSCHPYN